MARISESRWLTYITPAPPLTAADNEGVDAADLFDTERCCGLVEQEHAWTCHKCLDHFQELALRQPEVAYSPAWVEVHVQPIEFLGRPVDRLGEPFRTP